MEEKIAETPLISLKPSKVYVYHYDKDTHEFLYKADAEIDNQATKRLGYNVPLLPAYSTLKLVPDYGENVIPVYSSHTQQKTITEAIPVYDEETGELISYEEQEKTVDNVIENWVIKPDYRKNFYKVDDNLCVQEITTIGEQEGFYIVDRVTGDLIKQNPDKYKILDNQVIAKTEDEYQAEQLKRETEIQIQHIKTELYELDLEAIRPLRAILAGNQTDEDLNKLKDIEFKVLDYRNKLSEF